MGAHLSLKKPPDRLQIRAIFCNIQRRAPETNATLGGKPLAEKGMAKQLE